VRAGSDPVRRFRLTKPYPDQRKWRSQRDGLPERGQVYQPNLTGLSRNCTYTTPWVWELWGAREQPELSSILVVLHQPVKRFE